MKLTVFKYTLFISTVMLFTVSCSTNKLITENNKLKARITELEHRVYDLTDSPNYIAGQVMHDVDLLTTIPSRDNIEFALQLIQSFFDSYPNYQDKSELLQEQTRLKTLLEPQSDRRVINTDNYTMVSNEDSPDGISSPLMLQFSVQVVEKKSGFVSVELKVQNLSQVRISNLWLKAGFLDEIGEKYGMTQDFFISTLAPFEFKTETLNWEYIKLKDILGVQLSQIRYIHQQQTRFLVEEEVKKGQGNVKIFLVF